VDASYSFANASQVHAWYTHDKNEADELTPLTAAATKVNDLSEVGNSFGVGVRGTISPRVRAGADAEYFRTVSKYRQTIVGGTLPAGLVPLPDVTNKLLRMKLYAQYAIQKNADIGLNLIYEYYKTDDWTWRLLPPTGPVPFVYGTATDGTMVLMDPKQNSTFIGVRYTYRFQ
jgi:hypothetical protein